MTPTPTDQAPKLEAEAREWWNAHVAPLIGREWAGLVHRDRAASAYTAAFNAGLEAAAEAVKGCDDPTTSTDADIGVSIGLARAEKAIRALKVEA